MELFKELLGSSDPKPESKVQPKAVPKVEAKPVAKVETKPVAKVDLKPVTNVELNTVTKAVPKVEPVDNGKLQQLQQELKQAERDYTDSIWSLMAAKQQYFLLKNGYDRDPANSSKEAVLEASVTLADCQSRQDVIDRRRKSLKKQIAELKGGVTS